MKQSGLAVDLIIAVDPNLERIHFAFLTFLQFVHGFLIRCRNAVVKIFMNRKTQRSQNFAEASNASFLPKPVTDSCLTLRCTRCLQRFAKS